MGYRSDVVLMAVFENAEQHDEVMSIYRMDPKVQQYGLEKEWRRVDLSDGVVVRIYEVNGTKWYDSYDDVDALKELENVMSTFHEEREFGYAWGYARIGEDDTDIEYEVNGAGDNDLKDVVYDNLNIVRHLELNI
jgi:hypothetical protein